MTDKNPDPSWPVDARVPLDLVVELAEGRIRKARQATIRWAIGMSLTATGIALGWSTWLIQEAEQTLLTAEESLRTTVEDDVRDAVASRDRRGVGYILSAESFSGRGQAQIGSTTVNLAAGQRRAYTLARLRLRPTRHVGLGVC